MQLQRNSIRQVNTVSEIYEQQVLDNLAKFVNNPYVTPSFAVASQATNGVKDEGRIAVSDGGFVGRFWANVSAGGSRAVDQNFTLVPVTSPARLKLMQCAYQRAVGHPPDECSKCCNYLAAWTGDPASCYDPCGVTCGWVCKSDCWRDVPKTCCDSYAKNCGTYIWVDPCQRQEFSKLVMTIIDYAAGQPASGPGFKDVTYYLNEAGEFATKGTHVQEVHAVVSADDSSQTIENDLRLSASAKFHASQDLVKSAVENAPDFKTIESLLPSLHAVFPDLQIEPIPESSLRSGAMLNEYKMHLRDGINEHTPPSIAPSASDQMFRQATPRIYFGPPTQFNGIFGGGILQQQQMLNTVPFSNRN